MKKPINKYFKILVLILIPIILFFFLPDFSSYPKSLNTAFQQAGDNQSELKKVIRHYSRFASDSLKRKAAIFLIENMDAHDSYQSDQWEKLQVVLDSLFRKETDYSKLKPAFDTIYNKYNFSGVHYVSDLKTIKANFLIRNIDEAFRAWQSPYAKHLSFEDFCEYILPYRVGEEPLSDWRKEFDENLIPDLFKRIRDAQASAILQANAIPIPYEVPKKEYDNWALKYAGHFDLNVYLADKIRNDSIQVRAICDGLKNPPGTMSFLPGDLPDFNAHLLSVLRLGSCKHYAQQAVLAARHIGLPVVMDVTPQWATRSFSHEWNALLDKGNKPLSFGFGDHVKLGEHIYNVADRIPPKVFRITFSKQPSSLAQICGNENIPVTLMSACMKDVTNDYYQTIDVPVEFFAAPPSGNKFAYLSVFDNKDWIPVAWAQLNKQRAVFKNLNTNIACLPSYYHQGRVIPAAYPILLLSDKKTISVLKPNLQKRETVVLNRKYQARMSAWLGPSMIGGRFQVANDSTFAHPVDIHVIKDTAEAYFKIVPVNMKRKYKYFRYILPNNPNGGLAEIELCPPGSYTKLTGRAFGNNHPLGDRKFANAFDGDVLTQYQTKEAEGSWVGLAFDKPERIGRIAYLRRNDGNCICNGELYELFYWDNQWISLGQQTGSNETYRLIYKNVPTNALLLLRNFTKGTDERIFTYENGKQVWW